MRLHIIDSTLRDRRGHHYEYAKSLYDEWVSRGLAAEVYCNKDAEDDLCRHFGAMKIFSRDIHEFIHPLPDSLRVNFVCTFLSNNYVFWRELRGIDPARFSRSDLVLFHTINPNQLFGALLWHRLLRVGSRPRLVLLFRYGLGVTATARWIYTVYYRLFFRIASVVAGPGITFASDSENLAEEYGRLACAKIWTLPIPHLPDAGLAGPRPPGRGRMLLYLGDARLEKGYQLLPGMIEDVLRVNGDVRFVVQSNTPADPPEEIRSAIRKLKTFPDRVTVVERIMQSEEYYRYLSQSDGVLLPYCPAAYGKRTSGIFAEALAFGKPAVVTKGTWMEQEILRYEGCGVAFDYSSRDDHARAVEALLSRCDDYQLRARNAAGKWRNFHNARTYVDILIAMVEGGGSPAGPGRGVSRPR